MTNDRALALLHTWKRSLDSNSFVTLFKAYRPIIDRTIGTICRQHWHTCPKEIEVKVISVFIQALYFYKPNKAQTLHAWIYFKLNKLTSCSVREITWH